MISLTNKLTAFVLVFILFAHNINTLVIIGDFVVNQATIAKNFCIQKENQQGCNGKCQLMKELKPSIPKSNSDFPTQETRRLSLDVFCLFPNQKVENQIVLIGESHKESHFNAQLFIETYLEIDTPPPNFI